MERTALLMACILAASAARTAAQSYRVRIDASAQSVSFRGLARDSISSALVVAGADGSLLTPDGYAVRCIGGGRCLFLKPGAMLHGLPLTTSASVVLWGLGVEGLSFHASGRLVADAGRDRVMPGMVPAGQFLEGYLELRRSVLLLRAGRQLVSSRLEPIGFDGGQLRVRWEKASLDVTGYGGWGLGQAAALPASSPALNPLDEWRPRDRQLVAGAEAAWAHEGVDARAEYRREIDPQDNYFVSERAALSVSAHVARLRMVAGVDYNIAEARAGSVDVELTYGRPRFSVSAGARRYQPYFSLWTLWGAFSPVPYDAANASAEIRLARWLTLRARGEGYRYSDADVSTGLVPQLRDRGWRASTGLTATLTSKWTMDGTWSLENGPGAAGRFVDGSVTFTPDSNYTFDFYGGTMARPLELRFYDANSRWIGGRASRQVGAQHRVWTDIAFLSDERDRPDAGASNLAQVRVRGGMSVTFGSRADRTPLPPARRLRR